MYRRGKKKEIRWERKEIRGERKADKRGKEGG